MGRGKTVRYYDDAERKLVEEICDLRERERALITRLQKTRTIVAIRGKIKADELLYHNFLRSVFPERFKEVSK